MNIDPDKVLTTFEKIPTYVERLREKRAQLNEIKKTQHHSADIECQIEIIEQKCEFIKEFFEIIISYLDINLGIMEQQFEEIDDLLE